MASATASLNGKPQRKQLSDQIDRLDGILDCLAEEYRIGRAVTSADRRGRALARNTSKRGYMEVSLLWKPKRTDDPVMVKALREHAPGAWTVWINGQWHEIETG